MKVIYRTLTLLALVGLLFSACGWDKDLGLSAGAKCPPRNDEGELLGEMISECYDENYQLGEINVDCSVGQIMCNGKCVDPKSNAAFCGAKGSCQGEDASASDYAGINCGEDKVCRGGICACASGDVLCDGVCVNPKTNQEFCGAKGNCEGEDAGEKCLNDQSCQNGACRCPAGKMVCDGKCVDPATDKQYCGAKGSCSSSSEDENSMGKKCAGAQICDNGVCTCPRPGNILCGDECIDPSTNKQYCGASGDCKGANAGTTCNDIGSNIKSCVEKKCVVTACTANHTLCPQMGEDATFTGQNICVSLSDSHNHCGACNTPCNPTKYFPAATFTECTNGRCHYQCGRNSTNCNIIEGGNVSTIEPLCISNLDMSSNPYHCGACNTNCVTGANVKVEACKSGNCYCSESVCKKSEACTTGCALVPNCGNTADKCGVSCINCTENAVSAKANCTNQKCAIGECQQGYHVESNTTGDRCVGNTSGACAPPQNGATVENCSDIANAKLVSCNSTGKCEVIICDDGYTIVRGEGLDPDQCVENS